MGRTTKLQLLKTCVFSTLLYASETWTLKKADRKKLLSFETQAYRRILGIRWQEHRKLNLFGHVCRMNDERLVKHVMLGMVDGTRSRGRPRRCWMDDVREWCGCGVAEAVRMATDRRLWNIQVERIVGLYGSH